MSPKRTLEAELATLDALRHLSPAAARPEIAKALTSHKNLIVSKAAALALHHHLTSLAPNLVAAFPRFLEDPTESDRQCWAKNELAKALAAFGYQDHEFFLAGMRHIQLEPVWGGLEDTAGTLRGICALALVQCRELNSHRVLLHLVPLLTDKDVFVRVNVVRAIQQIGTDSAVLLLRLLAELASGEPEVLGACYSGVLAIEGPPALDWVARFLRGEDDASAELAMAIAQTHTPEAFRLLQTTHGQARDSWFRKTVLTAMALTRRQEAIDWLIDLVAKDDALAASAHEALCRSGPSDATQDRLKQLGRPCG
jgi:HEAT repeat protein